MNAGKRTLNTIFVTQTELEIPFFQRAYVWGEDEWERLLTDMIFVNQQRRAYFFGSVILKETDLPENSDATERFIIVDGQQRLTTLTIFFKVLCLKTANQLAFDLSFRQLDKSPKLLHNHNDVAAFNRIMELEKAEELEGNDNITRAYEYFRKSIDPETLNIQVLMANINFVGVTLDRREDEQQIFDTINSLGVSLTTAELLKNHFFNRDEFSLYERLWKSVFEENQQTKEYWNQDVRTGRIIRKNIDLFFGSYLHIRSQDDEIHVSTADRELFRRTDKLFESYKHFITKFGIDREELLQDIKEYAAIYRQYFNAEEALEDISSDAGIGRINTIIFGLESTTLIPYVLYILRNQPDEEERNQLFGYLESYLLRRMVCHATTKNYNQLFQERLIGHELLTRQELKAFLTEQEDKTNYVPGDEELQRGFHESRLINKQTTGILYFLESKIRSSRHSTRLKGLREYSLEHVMPKKWQNKWKGANSADERFRRSRKLLTLGNLTIIPFTLNASIRDSSWSVKKKGRSGKKGLSYYATGIDTFSPFLDRADWNEQVIEERADFLYRMAKEVWPVETMD